MVTLENMAVHFSGRHVLRDVNFSLRPGEIAARLGANGSGKTTTVKVPIGLLAPNRGRVLLDGRDANLRGLSQSLEDVFPGWVLEDDPERTATRILDLVCGDRP